MEGALADHQGVAVRVLELDEEDAADVAMGVQGDAGPVVGRDVEYRVAVRGVPGSKPSTSAYHRADLAMSRTGMKTCPTCRRMGEH